MDVGMKFSWKWFLIGVGSILIPFVIIGFLLYSKRDAFGWWTFDLLFFIGFFLIIGLVLWGAFTQSNKSLARGLFIGGVLPLICLIIIPVFMGIIDNLLNKIFK